MNPPRRQQTIEGVPKDVLSSIIQYCDVEDLVEILCVSRHFNVCAVRMGGIPFHEEEVQRKVFWHLVRKLGDSAVGYLERVLDNIGRNRLGEGKLEKLLRGARGNGCLEMVRMLLRRGADVNGVDAVGWTGLIWASRWGHVEVVRLLVESGANVDAVDRESEYVEIEE